MGIMIDGSTRRAASNRPGLRRVPAVVDRHEASYASFDQLLIHEVGVLEPRQRICDGGVLDFDGDCRTVEGLLFTRLLTGERALRRGKGVADDWEVFLVREGEVDTPRYQHNYETDDHGLCSRGQPARPP